MEILQVSKNIESIIAEIGKLRKQIGEKGKAKAKAISDYDRKMAITIATLRNAEDYTLVGRTYKAPPTTVTEKIAKGICSEERYALELAESEYKSTISNLEAMKAQLCGFQSINRYLSEV